ERSRALRSVALRQILALAGDPAGGRRRFRTAGNVELVLPCRRDGGVKTETRVVGVHRKLRLQFQQVLRDLPGVEVFSPQRHKDTKTLCLCVFVVKNLPRTRQFYPVAITTPLAKELPTTG